INMAYKLESDLEKTVEAFNDAYTKGDPKWFNHFADDASIYGENAAQPVEGREAYRRHFEKTLTGEKRQTHVLQQDAHMMGDTAVVMQLIELTTSGVATNVRESTIWRRSKEGWKVAHLNASIVGPVRAVDAARTAGAVKVLSEKIAIVSSQAGVAQ
ncbi:MAG TPA: nuclear transport factor 2 family protein, partial [Candidatus Angelobacter sp.]